MSRKREGKKEGEEEEKKRRNNKARRESSGVKEGVRVTMLHLEDVKILRCENVKLTLGQMGCVCVRGEESRRMLLLLLLPRGLR